MGAEGNPDQSSAHIESYEAMLTFDADVLEIIEGKSFGPFSLATTTDVVDGRVTIAGSADGQDGPEVTFPWLLAGCGDKGRATRDGLLRGDGKGDGEVTIFDALFIAQCLAGQKQFGTGDSECNPVNAASVRQDGEQGDSVSIKDALFIAQYMVKSRDEYFN